MPFFSLLLKCTAHSDSSYCGAHKWLSQKKGMERERVGSRFKRKAPIGTLFLLSNLLRDKKSYSLVPVDILRERRGVIGQHSWCQSTRSSSAQQINSQSSLCSEYNSCCPLSSEELGSQMESVAVEVPSLLSNQSSESCAAAAETTVEDQLFGWFYIVVFVLALSGNSLALWIFSRQRGVFSPANVFLIHLAVADLSYVIILPLRAIYHFTGGHWPLGEVPCRVVGFLFYVNMYASLYFLACVAGDRYLAVVHAVRSMKIRNARYAHIISFSLWVLVAVSMAPLLITHQTAQVDNTTVCLQLYREKASRKALISLAVAFTPPFLATLSCYLLIIRSLHRGSRLEPALKLRALRTIGVVMLIYVVCFLPYHMSRATFILGYNHPDVSCQTRRALSMANRLTSSLTCLNGAMDPLVYLFGAEKFRSTLRQLFCKDKAGMSGATSGELKGTHESSLSAKSEF